MQFPSMQSACLIINYSLIVHSLGGEGYLNFEGNEFGHPEVSVGLSGWRKFS
jgi:hypothetical protein